jgi:4a-hydroxytetrahydrobiopterin dehydratase
LPSVDGVRIPARRLNKGHEKMERLDDVVIEDALRSLDGWERDGDAIVRDLRLQSFRAAIDAIVAIADLADAANHHPDLANSYNRLTIRLTTHDAGGITEKDLVLARSINEVLAA